MEKYILHIFSNVLSEDIFFRILACRFEIVKNHKKKAYPILEHNIIVILVV